MALKPTIYKAQVELADSDRNCFESLSLTLAQHPSETLERMAVRLLAYCLNASPRAGIHPRPVHRGRTGPVAAQRRWRD